MDYSLTLSNVLFQMFVHEVLEHIKYIDVVLDQRQSWNRVAHWLAKMVEDNRSWIKLLTNSFKSFFACSCSSGFEDAEAFLIIIILFLRKFITQLCSCIILTNSADSSFALCMITRISLASSIRYRIISDARIRVHQSQSCAQSAKSYIVGPSILWIL